jgi:hypothetical protein
MAVTGAAKSAGTAHQRRVRLMPEVPVGGAQVVFTDILPTRGRQAVSEAQWAAAIEVLRRIVEIDAIRREELIELARAYGNPGDRWTALCDEPAPAPALGCFDQAQFRRLPRATDHCWRHTGNGRRIGAT